MSETDAAIETPELTGAVKQRTNARRQLSIIASKLESYLKDSKISEVTASIELLHETHNKLESANSVIENYIELDDNEFEKTLEYKEKYFLTVQQAKEFLDLNKATKSSTDVVYTNSDSVTNLTNKTQPSNPVKLTKLSLPVFEGNPLKFITFWESFESRVDNNVNLSDIDKLEFLRENLKGEAFASIEALEFSSEGYKEAKAMILRRYGKKAPLINLHLSALFDLPYLDSNANVKILRKTCDQMHIHVRSLRALNVNVENNSEVLVAILLARLPTSTRVKWQEKKRLLSESTSGDSESVVTDEPNTSVWDLLEFFTNQVEDLEVGLEAKSAQSSSFRKSSSAQSLKLRSNKPSRVHSVTTSLMSSSFKSPRSKACLLCKRDNHTLPKDCNLFNNASHAERLNLVKSAVLCFNCLSPAHRIQACQSSGRCRHCGSKHHTLLCKENPQLKADQRVDVNTTMVVGTTNTNCTEVILQTLRVRARGPKCTLTVRLLLDGCSNRSFISHRVARKLGLRIVNREKLMVNSFNAKSTETTFDVCQLELSALPSTGCSGNLNLQLYACDTLCYPIANPQVRVSDYPHLKSLTFTENYALSQTLPIDILIGSDYIYDILTDQIKRGPQGSPVAIETIFGWVLHGPKYNSSIRISQPVNILHCQVSKTLENMWNLDSIGITPDKDRAEIQQWIDLSIHNDRFLVKLPWISDERPCGSFAQLQQRQNRVLKRLSYVKQKEYDDYLNALEDDQITEACQPCEKDRHIQTWYLPHRDIQRNNKLRIVFDGGFGKPSLNQCLETGPNILQKIPISLTSFRLYKVPVVADVKSAFLQIAIDEGDRDFLRFVWKDKHWRFRRLLFGLNCGPSILNTCLDVLYSQWEASFPDIVQILRESIYCDDLTTSVPTESCYEHLQHVCTQIFASVSMNLDKWSTTPEKVLGVSFNSETDSFQIKTQVICTYMKQPLTRRLLVSQLAKVFDPLGLIIPWSMKGKLLIQCSWKPEVSWDEPLEEINSDWNLLMKEAELIPIIEVTRHLHHSTGSCLHVFSDASEHAYGTCVYLVTGNKSHLVFARNRLNPKRSSMTIPRLELMGAILAVRAVQFLRSNITEWSEVPIVYWTDSTCVLGWISKRSTTWKVFVRNRVKEIQAALTPVNDRNPPTMFRYCPGKDNPADLATRGISLDKLKSSNLWWNGPSWIMHPEEWPAIDNSYIDSTSYSREFDLKPKSTTSLLVHGTSEDLETMIQAFSSLPRVVSVFAYIGRFFHNCREKGTKSKGPLIANERCWAKNKLIIGVQNHFYPEEKKAIEEGRKLSRGSPLLVLHPIIEKAPEGHILKVLPRNGEKPKILLPPKSHLTSLIIMSMHQQNYHAGVDFVLRHLQQEFWLVKGRRVIKSILKFCNQCKRHQGRSYEQTEACLASFRQDLKFPFCHTGLDHAGPLFTKSGNKAYILLFCCSSTRAMHLELVSSMDVKTTELAIRRFFSRRGTPQVLYSDNAKVFRALSSQLQINWKFIPERSPTWGGWWERLIKTTKLALRKTLHKTSLNFDELATVLTEVEKVINERPLTYVSDESGTLSPLRPVDFLLVPSPSSSPWAEATSEQYRAKLRYRTLVSRQLINRWRKEYLPALRQWRKSDAVGKFPKIGDIVLVRDGDRRSAWPLAKVTRLFTAKDGKVRAVEILLNQKLTRRATYLLYPLELDSPWSSIQDRDQTTHNASEIKQDASKDTDSEIIESTSGIQTIQTQSSIEAENVVPKRLLRHHPERIRRKPDHLKDYIL